MTYPRAKQMAYEILEQVARTQMDVWWWENMSEIATDADELLLHLAFKEIGVELNKKAKRQLLVPRTASRRSTSEERTSCE